MDGSAGLMCARRDLFRAHEFVLRESVHTIAESLPPAEIFRNRRQTMLFLVGIDLWTFWHRQFVGWLCVSERFEKRDERALVVG